MKTLTMTLTTRSISIATITVTAPTPQMLRTTSLVPSANVYIKIINSTITSNPKHSDYNDPDLITKDSVQLFFCLLYATVFVLGVFGNMLVCYVVLRNKAMQTVTNIFITNLALSDILLCALAVPFTPLYTFMGRWAFGRTLCHLVPFAQGCSIYISTLTLTAIAIDRYFVIIYPFHPRMKLSTCISTIVGIWMISLLATLPYGMYVKVVIDSSGGNLTKIDQLVQNNETFYINESLVTIVDTINYESTIPTDSVTQKVTTMPSEVLNISYCEENWPSEQYRKIFGSITSILQFALPFTIISICYIWVSIKLNSRARAKPGTKSSKREEADRDRKRRTNRMLISMVAVFGLSWLPINIVNVLNDFYEKSNEWRFYTICFFVSHSIAMSSTCYNPFLYAWLNENFRKEFKHVLPFFHLSSNNIINIGCVFKKSHRSTCDPNQLETRHNDDLQPSIATQDKCENKREKDIKVLKQQLTSQCDPAFDCKISSIHFQSDDSKTKVPLLQRTKNSNSLFEDPTSNHNRNWVSTKMDNNIDSTDEKTVELRFYETTFTSSDNNDCKEEICNNCEDC
ncbi:prolactin-releasing peptide receptor [Teleopsis dalmanni]|uniref:prolactin-releasing peptide receptor n=1 Tax=Teleopsis dalmanni TaxID=139649 RepID=UPI0018CE1C29|nr:prolactin-releasing peptide receptor [Teleopsis dalmanni]XP_037940743.1 prolactin-releasing peptide receptor [Teleopsis dalmanni]